MESYLLRGHPSGDTLLVGDGGGSVIFWVRETLPRIPLGMLSSTKSVYFWGCS